MKVIAVVNQKGGVGKTVSTVNIAVGLARKGKRVLAIDLDPQGSLTVSLGEKVFLSTIQKERWHSVTKVSLQNYCNILMGVNSDGKKTIDSR